MLCFSNMLLLLILSFIEDLFRNLSNLFWDFWISPRETDSDSSLAVLDQFQYNVHIGVFVLFLHENMLFIVFCNS